MQKEADKTDVDYVIYTMTAIVSWYDMYVFCQSRSSCNGCPYKHKGICDKTSTFDIMKRSAEIFRYFLES